MPRRFHLSMPGVSIEADDGPTFRALVERLLGREAAIPQLPTADVGKPIDDRRLPALTEREREIARLICEGLTTPQIAAKMVVEAATVKSHRRNMNKKLGSTSRERLEATRAEWDAGD